MTAILLIALLAGSSSIHKEDAPWPSSPATGSATTIAGPTAIAGRATWYAASGMTAAAGPLLRKWLGKDWRGTTVRFSTPSRSSLIVTLSDWCLCSRGRRLIDLSDDAFAQLAPLSVGVLRVTVSRVNVPEPPATDR